MQNGATWLTRPTGVGDREQLAGILKVPDSASVVVMTPLGYPERPSRVKPREELSSIVSYESYGAA
ncbi:MAG: hypothetical protein ACOC58_01365 [Chloroflexota bacterium]